MFYCEVCSNRVYANYHTEQGSYFSSSRKHKKSFLLNRQFNFNYSKSAITDNSAAKIGVAKNLEAALTKKSSFADIPNNRSRSQVKYSHHSARITNIKNTRNINSQYSKKKNKFFNIKPELGNLSKGILGSAKSDLELSSYDPFDANQWSEFVEEQTFDSENNVSIRLLD